MTSGVEAQTGSDAGTDGAAAEDDSIVAGDSATEDESTIVVSGLRKAYGDAVAVDGISLEIAAGEVFALVGPNGAGKTTTVRAVTGTLEPDDGRVRVLGERPRAVDADRIGVLPQSFTPHRRLTPMETVSHYAGLYADARDPAAVLEDVGLDPSRDTWYEDLSGGERRRLAVATTIVNDPDLIFLDEPTTGIDPAGRHRLWDLFESIAATGTTIVLTTHDMAEAERLADRVGFLANGRLVRTGSPAALIERFGGSSRLVLETDAIPDAIDGFEARETQDGLVVRDVEPTEVGEAVTAVESAGATVEALSWREPTLEDAYLSLVDETANGDRT
ncbi:MAG: ABC transporter ATP-binding protein [Halanaeroarchaeum sp.]